MENANQDAMLKTAKPETGGPIQIPDEGEMLNQDYNPTDLSGDVNSAHSTPTDEQESQLGNAGAFSGSPNMEPDTRDYGNGDTLGNNDGTEPDPSITDEPN